MNRIGQTQQRLAVILCLTLWAMCSPAWAQKPGHGRGEYFNVRDFGAQGDGSTDDTKAIAAALDAASSVVWSMPPPGSSYYITAPTVFIPSGRYMISDTLPAGHANLLGEGSSIIHQKDPEKDIFSGAGVWRWQVTGLTLFGGRHQLHIGNQNIDGGHFVIDKCTFQKAGGVAINIRPNTASSQLIIKSCIFIHNRQVLISRCDGSVMTDSWISGAPDQDNVAMIENRGWRMRLENILGVPNANGVDQRWIDNYGYLTCQNFRFGGEGGGFTPVVNFAKYNKRLGGPMVILDDCWVSAESNFKRRCAVYCEEVPNLIEVRNCVLAGVPAIKVDKAIDLENYFKDVRPGMLQFHAIRNVGEFADQIPDLLKSPVIVASEDAAGKQLSPDETKQQLTKAIAFQKTRPGQEQKAGKFDGHDQQTDPAKYLEISYDKYEWDLNDLMDATSEANRKYLAAAPCGDDVILMRRIGEGGGNWPHVLIRGVEVDLDRFPYLTFQQKDPGIYGEVKPLSYAIRIIDRQTEKMVQVDENPGPHLLGYRAYNIKERLGVTGRRTLDIRFYFLGSTVVSPTEFIFADAGDYMLVDFLRMEAE